MLGASVPAIGGYHMGFKTGNEWGCDCIQIYITPSRTWNVPKLSQAEIVKFKTTWKKARGNKGYKKVLSEFDKIIGIEKIKAIHLNDSKTDLGSRVDRHAFIGEGKIGLEMFQAIIKDKRFKNIPKILENPVAPAKDTKTKANLKLLRKFA